MVKLSDGSGYRLQTKINKVKSKFSHRVVAKDIDLLKMFLLRLDLQSVEEVKL